MNQKVDIILQGALTQYAADAALHYLKIDDVVNHVVLSCWDCDPDINVDHPNCKIHRSKSISNPGMLNRNRQITTSLNGIRASTSEYVVKLRNDQKISHNSFRMMHQFYANHSAVDKDTFSNRKIGIASVYPAFPMHPRDHIFWGHREDMIKFFDIPFDNDATEECLENYDRYVRCETYIAMWYFARQDSEVMKYINAPLTYLTDSAPMRLEAMKRGEQLFDKLFLTFPYIELEWSKPGYKRWPYNDHCGGEYWDLGRAGTRYIYR